MIRLIAAVLLFIAAPAMAQGQISKGALDVAPSIQPKPAPSDQEIDDAHALCNQPDHFSPIYTELSPGIKRMTGMAYKPGWENCTALDAEYQKRSLDKKKKDQTDIDRVNSVLGRIAK